MTNEEKIKQLQDTDIVKFAESTLGLELTEFQKKLLRINYEHKDDGAKETLYTAIDKAWRRRKP